MKQLLLYHILFFFVDHIAARNLESQLYEDLLYGYNKIARPVKNSTEVVQVRFGSNLIRIIDVDEKNQVLTTNLWLEMEWDDSKLTWDPDIYGGLTKIHIPGDMIWTPDIVLYNNAAGDPDITIYTDALVHHDGTVVWKPPAIYKSFCPIDVTWFPYDSQNCTMKFGTWSYTGYYVNMSLTPGTRPEEQITKRFDVLTGKLNDFIEVGMDISYYHRSAEWDLISLNAERHQVVYTSCCGPEKYVDVTYYLILRRKTLFFTCNLIIPCFLISFLTTFVFYLSDHKITFAISLLVTLTVFFLVLIDIIPPTSDVIPMFARYLMVTMVLVTFSIMLSVISVNFHFRSGATHHMPDWMRRVFLGHLPRLLCMARPGVIMTEESETGSVDARQSISFHLSRASGRRYSQRGEAPPPILFSIQESPYLPRKIESREERHRRVHKQLIVRVLQHVRFIADHFRELQEEQDISDDWTFVAMVIDRLFLIIFACLNMASFSIILQAPSITDTRGDLRILAAAKPLGQMCQRDPHCVPNIADLRFF